MVTDSPSVFPQSSVPLDVIVMVPPAHEVQFDVITGGILPLFSHGPVSPFVNVATGALVNDADVIQFNVEGKVGIVNTAGGAGVTVIVEDPVKALPQFAGPE